MARESRQPAAPVSRGVLEDLTAFAAVARQRSFARAAAELNMSPSMLSYVIKRLEKRLGFALLQRTSRSVAPNDAGLRLLDTLEPALQSIDEVLTGLSESSGSLIGSLRLTMTGQAYQAVIQPALYDFTRKHPHATIEILIDYGFRDIVKEGFDGGIRLGEKVHKDMVSISIGPPLRMAVVVAPAYADAHPPIAAPEDLRHHRCINYRMTSAGSLLAWEFQKGAQSVRINPPGNVILNDPASMLGAALGGVGVAYLLEQEVMPYLASGQLLRFLDDWCAPFPGFHFYYPSRQRKSTLLAAFVEHLKSRPASQAGRAASKSG